MNQKLKWLVFHSRCECLAYFSIWIISVMKIIYSLWKTSQVLELERFTSHFHDGWIIIGRKQDQSDFEWISWKEIVFGGMWLWFVLHIFIAQTLRRLHLLKMRKYIFISFSIVFLVMTLGPSLTFFYLSQIVFIVTVGYLTNSNWAVWSTSLAFLSFLVVPEFKSILTDFGLFMACGDVSFYFQEYLLTMGLLRYTDSALFIASSGDLFLKSHVSLKTKLGGHSNGNLKERKIPSWQWSDILCYNLYFPLSIFGPFITFEDFYFQFIQVHITCLGDVIQRIRKAVIKSCIWFLVMETSSHFIYYSALINNPHVLHSVPLWSLAGVGYVTGQMFMVKYFILWNSISVVTLLDHISIPALPCCISRVYLYSDMWKMFDRGLYEFLKRHIYIPMGGNRQGRMRRQVASLTSFAFVLLWHGVTNSIMVWVVVNFVALFCEEILLINAIITEKLNISPAWARRVHSVVSIPILGLSTFGIFVFLGSLESASIICYRILTEGLPINVLFLCIIAYCMIETGKDCENYLNTKKSEKSLKTD